ncbi:MAG: GspH/FimT family pseudopilin [Rhodocyclaceae bacterium]|jgi:type IV fimbrial biogenesis protein FimT|nr:GspH/FimT family pseudopilin [Rhodocyclaceae bacterium]
MLVNQRGLTVIELMIVIVIVGILASIAAPSFRNILATVRIKTAASDIHLSLMRARSEAIKRNTNITTAAPSGWLAGWTVSDGIETHAAIAGSGISISGATTIIYTPNGRVTTNPINISLTSTDTTVARCVSVSLSGQPLVKPEACS